MNLQNIFSFEDYQKLLNAIKDKSMDSEVIHNFIKENLIYSLIQNYVNEEGANFEAMGHKTKYTEFLEELKNSTSVEALMSYDKENYHSYYSNWMRDSLNVIIFIVKYDILKNIEEGFKDNELYQKYEALLEQVHSILTGGFTERCSQCGKLIDFKNLFQKNQHLASAVDECSFQSNIHTLEINIPSGVLVANDWFRDKNNILTNLTDVNNSQYGKRMLAKGYSDLKYIEGNIQEFAQVVAGVECGLVTVFTGNTSPHIYQNGNSLIICEKIDFSNYDYDEDSETEEEFEKRVVEFQKSLQDSGWQDVGYVCTDLWRASLIDYDVLKDHFLKHYDEDSVDDMMSKYQKINVEPGKYKITFSSKSYNGVDILKSNSSEIVNFHPFTEKDRIAFLTFEKV